MNGHERDGLTAGPGTAATLRGLLEKGPILVAPGAYDAWSARLVEKAGFKAVYMTGFGASASVLGMPDLGLMTASEMACQASRIADAVTLPVIADADTGFGNSLNVRRTVRQYRKAGVAAIQIEDQVLPKKCGHMENKEIVGTAEMGERIRAASEACGKAGPVLIARTDARSVLGLDEALRRGEAYLAAGAEVLFIEAPKSDDELRRICDAFRGVPLIANVVEGGKSPYHAAAELEEIGFALAIYPISALLAATRAVIDALGEIATFGKLTDATPHVSFTAFNDLMGLKNYLDDAPSRRR